MRSVFLFLWTFLSSVILLSCDRNQITSVIWPAESFLYIREGKIIESQSDAQPPKAYKMIHYDGPQNCTSCLLKFYYKWDDIMDKIGRDNVDYLFVLGPQEDMSIDKILQSLNENYTSCLVAVDVNGEFRESNPSIAQSDNVDILLNKDNEVLGVFHIMENNGDVDDIRTIVMDSP